MTYLHFSNILFVEHKTKIRFPKL